MKSISGLGRWTGCLVLAASMAGCATITKGARQTFTVNSTPPGATVRTSTGHYCEQTPCTMVVRRKDGFVATISKPGFHTAELQVHHRIGASGAFAFLSNALIGGLIGAAVDVSTGAPLELNPNPLTITLAPAPALGVTLADPEQVPALAGEDPKLAAVAISTVVPGSIADRGGLRVGDLPTTLDGMSVGSPQDLVRILGVTPSGKLVAASVLRSGQPVALKLQF
jgi:hypothetical protein